MKVLFQGVLFTVVLSAAFLQAEEIDFKAALKKTKSAPAMTKDVKEADESSVNKFGLRKTASAVKIHDKAKEEQKASFLDEFKNKKEAAERAKSQKAARIREQTELVKTTRQNAEQKSQALAIECTKMELKGKSDKELKAIKEKCKRAIEQIQQIDNDAHKKLSLIKKENPDLASVINDFEYILYDGSNKTPLLEVTEFLHRIDEKLKD